MVWNSILSESGIDSYTEENVFYSNIRIPYAHTSQLVRGFVMCVGTEA
jgi:hypothetical protein